MEGPQFNDTRQQAYNDVVDMLTDTGAVILPYNNQDDIVEFARA